MDKIGVVNQGPVHDQINYITINNSQKTQLVYSDSLPELRYFQGRTAEQSQIQGWLIDASVSIVGIRGEGGIGKSTLAAKVFAECPGFTGKFWADVRLGTSIIDLAERALQEFEMRVEQVQAFKKETLPQRLLRQLQMGRYLLAIDNLESLLTPAGEWDATGYQEFLDQFQDQGGQSVLLLASREYPSRYFSWLRSQWLILEKGLEPPEGAILLAVLEAQGTEEERQAVSEQVQGNPLALSLIAGWLRSRGRRDEDRHVCYLADHDNLFQVEGRHRLEQNISVEEALNWSFSRLTPDLQQLLIQVSVFRDMFTVEAAALLSERTVSNDELQDLERRSLLQELPDLDRHGLKKFRLQPRIRNFVQKFAGDQTEAHQKAIDYYHSVDKPSTWTTLEDLAEYMEIFYHYRELKQYSQAFATFWNSDGDMSCDKFRTYATGTMRSLVCSTSVLIKFDSESFVFAIEFGVLEGKHEIFMRQ